MFAYPRNNQNHDQQLTDEYALNSTATGSSTIACLHSLGPTWVHRLLVRDQGVGGFGPVHGLILQFPALISPAMQIRQKAPQSARTP